MALLYRLVELFAALALVFIPCELDDRLCSEFDDINDIIDELDWHLFPLKMKKLLPMIMMNSQQPVGFKCFGSYLCNRETYKKVTIAMHRQMKNFPKKRG